MSLENVEIVQRLYEAFNRRDLDDAVRCLDRDIELYLAITAPGRPSNFRGREGATEFLEVTIEDWERVTVLLKETIEAPDNRILAVERWRMRGRDGIEIDTEVTDVYAFRDGLIVRVDGFRDKAEALEAVGLPE